LLRATVPDGEPEQRRLEEVTALSLDQDHPVVGRQRPAEPMGYNEPTDTTPEDQNSFARHGRPR
jgi:hypothetical protein